MKALVPVKQVAHLPGGFVLDGLEPDTALFEWRLNESDEHALETALTLVDAGGGGEVLVASVGPEPAEAGLRACLAMGAARAVRVWDESLRGADALAVAEALAALAVREQPEVILCGVQSSEWASGATPAALAGLLELPRVSAVRGVSREDGRLVVERELEGGGAEILRVALPALLSVQSAPERPRRANLRAIKRAREAPLERVGPAELGLDTARLLDAAGSRVVAVSEPDRGAGARMLDGTPAQIAACIAEILAAERGA